MGNGMNDIGGRAVSYNGPGSRASARAAKNTVKLAPTPFHEAKKKDCLLQRCKSICDSLRDEPQSSPVSYSPVSGQ